MQQNRPQDESIQYHASESPPKAYGREPPYRETWPGPALSLLNVDTIYQYVTNANQQQRMQKSHKS